MEHKATTTIIGNVTGDARCHPNSKGVIANFTVEVTTPWGKGPPHTERYKCVAMGKMGAEIQTTIQHGQTVQCTGFMRTSQWTDGSGRENHRLICNAFDVLSRVNHQPPPRKPKQATQHVTTAQKKPKLRRQYGRNVRKQSDFRELAEPEPNDLLADI